MNYGIQNEEWYVDLSMQFNTMLMIDVYQTYSNISYTSLFFLVYGKNSLKRNVLQNYYVNERQLSFITPLLENKQVQRAHI